MPRRSMGLARKIRTVAEDLGFFSNFPQVYLDVFGLLGGKTYVVEIWNGKKFCARTRRYTGASEAGVVKEIWHLGAYCPDGFEISGTDVVLDIGAHIGAFSVYAASKATGGKVLSYEPAMETFGLLVENLKMNGVGNVVAFNKAVTEKAGKVKLFLSRNTGANSIDRWWSEKEGGANEVEADAITLEGAIRENSLERVDFLKMDCEGAEYGIFRSCPDSVFGRIARISMNSTIFPRKRMGRS